ncbi:phage holin family protein [Endozoicomonas sp. 8E]|uniref:phage holin family protein n=1 Tax=Endozoicomonas sp. 8E TaxID=3035692 RepID=UPI00293906F2|nr:phage holin family protein [Endozoicomonas sp. 8E]WOG29643.1 phage holin family protein [Endozoicomonas sp. 8E]
MLSLILYFLINGLAVFITARILKGVEIENYASAVLVSILLAVVNTFVKPILFFLTLPITILTLGLFILILNALMLMIVNYFIDSFNVRNFGWALLMSIVLSVINAALFLLIPGAMTL